MRKLTFQIKTEGEQSQTHEFKEFITDKTVEWTIEQYSRNRGPLTMELINNEETDG